MERRTKPAISKLRLPFFKRLTGRGTGASTVTDASSDAFILFDRNLNIVEMNPLARSVFHLILGENVIGEDVPSGAPNMKPDNKNNGRYEKHLNAIRKGKPFFADSIVIHSEFIDINLKAEAFKVGKGFGIIFSDLGTLRKTGETPYEAQKKLATNLQSAPDGIFIFDLKGTILHGSRAWEKLTGYAREEIKGKSFFEVPLFAPEYMPKAAQLLETSAAGEPSGPDQFELIRKDGSRVFVDISTCPIGGGEEVEVIAIAHDITERKKSEEALRKSEEKYEAIVETSLDGIYQVDISGKFTFMNESFANTFGYKQEELLGKQFSSLLSAGTLSKLVRMGEEVLSGKSVRDEVPVQHKDGHEVLVNISATPLKDRGKIIGLTGILRDITERKRAEEELAKSEANYRSLIETAGAGVASINLKGELVLVNEALCRMIGYSQEELLGRSFADFLNPDDNNEILEIFAQGLAGEREQPHLEFRGIRKDGHSVWCYSTPTAIVQGNELIGFSAIIQDITERKQAEGELRDSEERFRSILENAPFGYYRVGKDGLWQYVNPVWERMHGFSLEEVIGKPFEMTQTEDAVEQSRELVERALAREAIAGEFSRLRKDGDIEYHSFNMQPVKHGNEIVAIEGFINDITERKRAEEALKASEKRYRQLYESLMDTFASVDMDGRITEFNDAFSKMVGYAPEELYHLSYNELTPEKWHAAEAEIINHQVLTRGYSDLYEKQYHRKDGTVFPVELRTNLMRDDAGNPCGMWAIVRDITERKKMEEALRRSEKRYRQLVDNMQEGLWVIDKDSYTTFVNPRMAEILGYRVDEMQGKHLFEFMDELGVEMAKGLLERRKQGVREQHDFEFSRKDGTRIYASLETSPISDDDGNYIGALACLADITKRKQAEEALRESEERFRKVLDNAIDMIYWVNLKTGEYDYVAPSSEKVIGYAPDELIALGIVGGRSLVHPDDSERLDQNVIDLVMNTGNGNAPSGIEYRFAHKKLGYRWIFDNRSIVYEGNEAVAIVGIVRDITERKQAEQALRESEEKYRLLAENVTDVIWTMDMDLKFTYISSSVMRLRGLTVEEAMAERLEDIFSPSSFQALVEAFEEGMVAEATGLRDPSRSWIVELEECCKDGSLIWVEIRAGLLRDEDGRPVGLVGVTRDITKRKKLEELEKRRTHDLDLLSKAAMSLVKLRPDADIHYFIAERLQEFVGGAAVLVNSFDEASDTFCLREALGIGEQTEALTKILGFNPIGMHVPVSDEWKQSASLGELGKVPGGLYDLASGAIPMPVCQEIEKLLDLGNVYAIGFAWEGRLYGSACILTRNGTELRNKDVIETFVRQASIALQRRQAEESLKESEEKYKALVDTAGLAGEGIMIVERAEGNKAVIAFVNDALSGMLGYQQGEMPGMPARDLFLPGDRIWLQDKSRRRRKGEALPSHYAVMAWRKDGSMLPIEISMGAMRYQGKSATVIYVRDVTERKQAEEALRESEAQFRAIFDRAAIGVGLVDVNGRSLRINPALQRLLGYTIEEIRGMAFTDYMHPDDAMVDAGLFREMVAGKRDHYQVEKRYIRKDGQIVWGRMTLSAVRGLEGKFQFAIGMVEDITDSKLALDNVKKSEERFRSLIENTSEVVMIVDKDATITYASPSAERVLGYKTEEAIGKISFNFIHRDDMPEVMKLYDQTTQNSGGLTTAKVRVRHKDGSWRVAEGIGMNLLDNPAIGGIVVNFRDVTEREQVQEELLRHTRRVEALHAIAQTASQTLELEELLNTSLEKVIEVMEAEAGCVYLLDMVEKELVLRTSRGLSDETISSLATIKLNENNVQKILGWKGGSTPLRKIFEETGLSITKEVKEKEQIQSFAVAPFAVKGQLSGLIAVGNRAYRKFSPGDIDLLRAVGNQIGIGAQNAMLYEEVRALIRETIDAQERERERICLEVHDGVAQTLVSAFQYLQALEATAPDDTKAKQLLAKTSAQVKLAIQESREVINSLQPATLSDLGLVSTLRQELKRLGQETGLKIDFKADAIRLPKDIETGLYRIIREAVFNARKHANTKQLRVKINSEDERVKVEVRDWGKGFDQAYLDRARKRGTGLFSIRKRAELMMGDCEIQSEPGQGTTVRVEIPVSAAERSSG